MGFKSPRNSKDIPNDVGVANLQAQYFKSAEFELGSTKKKSPSPSPSVSKENDLIRLYGGKQETKKVYVPVLTNSYETVAQSPMKKVLKHLEQADHNAR